MKKIKSIAMAAIAAMVMTMGTAHADIFTGATGSEFNTATNWDTGVSPVGATSSTIDSGVTVLRTAAADSETGRLFVEGGSTLNVTSGTHSDSLTGAGTLNLVGNNSAGTVNQSGGAYSIGHALRIGGGNANSDGVFNLSGGSLNIFRGSNTAIQNNVGRPSLQIGSPTAGASGILEVSGGSLVTRFGSHLGDGGTFSVVGSGATSINIGNNANGEGHWVQRAGSTLSASIDAGGLTPIFIDDDNDDGVGIFAEFEAGSLLDLSFDGITPFSGTFTILELENDDIEFDSSTGTGLGGIGGETLNTLGLALSAGTDAFDGVSGWTFDVDNSGDNGLLTATFVAAIPEPSSLALLGLGGLVLVGRRRK